MTDPRKRAFALANEIADAYGVDITEDQWGKGADLIEAALIEAEQRGMRKHLDTRPSQTVYVRTP